jgi:hypothetical protein
MTLRPVAFVSAVCLLSSGTAEARDLPAIKASRHNAVPACATPGRLMAYLAQRNPKLEKRFSSIATHYMREGRELGVRWDYAFFQMIVETGALSFRRGSGEPGDVSPRQNNFAGLGATGNGEPGDAFPSIQLGVKAHLQHVLMYAGERIAAPIADRTRKVQEWGILDGWRRKLGRPVTFSDLAHRWVPTPKPYITNLESVARRFYEGHCGRPDPRPGLMASAHRSESGPAVRATTAGSPPPAMQATDGTERSALGAPRTETAPATPVLAADAMSMPGVIIVYSEREKAEAAERAIAAQPKEIATETAAKPVSWTTDERTAAVPHTAPTSPASRTTAPAKPDNPPTRMAALTQPTAVSKPAPTADETMRAWVSGKTVLLDTALGTSIPMLFRPNGTTAGHAGTLAPFLGAVRDEGRWWIERARLCMKWKVWVDGDVQCMRLRQVGSVIHWVRDDGKTGTARIVSR